MARQHHRTRRIKYLPKESMLVLDRKTGLYSFAIVWDGPRIKMDFQRLDMLKDFLSRIDMRVRLVIGVEERYAFVLIEEVTYERGTERIAEFDAILEEAEYTGAYWIASARQMKQAEQDKSVSKVYRW